MKIKKYFLFFPLVAVFVLPGLYGKITIWAKSCVANWKEHPKTEAEALKLFKAAVETQRARGVEVAVCPPFIYLEEIAREFRHMPAPARAQFAVGAQDVFWEEQGAFTSEVGPRMLRSLGVTYVIVGTRSAGGSPRKRMR